MKSAFSYSSFMAIVLLAFGCATSHNSKVPLRILLVTGGCCHNCAFQTEAIQQSLPASLPVQWTVINDGGKGTTAMIDLYKNDNWANGYDLVVHNECFADTKDSNYIRTITAAHYKGVNAVVIHCAMHTYRAADINDWRAFLGVTTRRHDHQSRYPVTVTVPGHPVMKGRPATWLSPKDELYIIEKTWPTATPLATSISEADGKTYPVVWTNRYGKARVFGTTFGHSDDTFRDTVFINLLRNGILWAGRRR